MVESLHQDNIIKDGDVNTGPLGMKFREIVKRNKEMGDKIISYFALFFMR